MDEELMWFDNPPRKRSKSRRKPPKGYKTWAAWSAAMRRAKSGGAKVAKKRRRRASAAKSTPKRRRRAATAAPRRRRRSHAISSPRAASRAGRVLRYRRRNPPSMLRGLPGKLVDAGLGAVTVIAGKTAALAIPKKLGLQMDGPMGLLAQVGVALAVGMAGSRISPKVGERLLIGGLCAPIESFLKGANVPIVSATLQGQDSYYAVGTYPTAPSLPSLSAYPQGMGDYVDDYTGGMYPQ